MAIGKDNFSGNCSAIALGNGLPYNPRHDTDSVWPLMFGGEMVANSEIVPFGKYKGQPVEVLANDKKYCDWLAGQQWFRTQFSGIHTLIVNNFTEPSDTPEHNDLQAKFLDNQWSLRFVRHVVDLNTIVNVEKSSLINSVNEEIKDSQFKIERVQQETWRSNINESVAFHQKKINSLREWLDCISGLKVAITISSVRFEESGVDVVIRFGISRHEPCKNASCTKSTYPKSKHCDFWVESKEIRVEIKPSVGYDYPSVLRQMKASRSNTLLIGYGGYCGDGVTFQQMSDIFKASRIKVIRVEDVDNANDEGEII